MSEKLGAERRYYPQEAWSIEVFDGFVEEIKQSLANRHKATGWLAIKNGMKDEFVGIEFLSLEDSELSRLGIGIPEIINGYYNWALIDSEEQEVVSYGNDNDFEYFRFARFLSMNLVLGDGVRRILPRVFITRISDVQPELPGSPTQ